MRDGLERFDCLAFSGDCPASCAEFFDEFLVGDYLDEIIDLGFGVVFCAFDEGLADSVGLVRGVAVSPPFVFVRRDSEGGSCLDGVEIGEVHVRGFCRALRYRGCADAFGCKILYHIVLY